MMKSLLKTTAFVLVTVLAPVVWRSDLRTYRGRHGDRVSVRIADHPANAEHPNIGNTYVAQAADLVAVQTGVGST